MSGLCRREMLGGVTAAALSAMPAVATTAAGTPPLRYPRNFLWGVATSGHQVEGNDVNDDVWQLEHVSPSLYRDKSGDADDEYHRYDEDIRLTAKLGLNAFRFSLEWSRIEPAEGEFSLAEINHYRNVLISCHRHGLAPVVTFNHSTTPRWFAARGGWENPASPVLFARYCERAARDLGSLIAVASTINEPNIGILVQQMLPSPAKRTMAVMLQQAAAKTGTPTFSTLVAGDQDAMQPNLLAAHVAARAAIKATRSDLPVGFTLAISDDQAVGDPAARDAFRSKLYGSWLKMATTDDYVAVQTYTRTRIGAEGILPVEHGVERTQMGYEFWPEALEATIRYAHSQTGKPVYVTENGIATDNDARRVAYIRRALDGLERCVEEGIPVYGYIHWSLLDNFEWTSGYHARFGLVAVDRATQRRVPKQSAFILGSYARAHKRWST